MPEHTTASITGRGEELERALREAREWAEANKKPDDSAPPQVKADWNAGARPHRTAISEAHKKAPVSALAAATAGDWRRAFKEAETAPNALGAALALAQRGALIFPCHPERKGPHWILGDIGGPYWATDNPAEITDWWTKAPDACIGMLMGRRTGVWAIDIDVGKDHDNVDGVTSFNRLESDLGGTRIGGRRHKTAGGGIHILFKWYDGGPEYKRDVDKAAYPGVEIIGDGAHIVVPPSKLLNGKQYTVSDECIPPAPPKKLTAAIKGEKGKEKEKVKKLREQPVPAADAKWDKDYCDRKLQNAVEAVRGAEKGMYDHIANKIVFEIGCIVGGGGIPDEVAWPALSEAANASGGPRDFYDKVQRHYEEGKLKPNDPPSQFIRWPDWYGRPLNTYMNALTALDDMDLILYFDELQQLGAVRQGNKTEKVSDALRLRMREDMHNTYKFDPGQINIAHALTRRCSELVIHPFREELAMYRADAAIKTTSLLPYYFGTKDTLYERMVGNYFLMSIVARVYKPGCKSDYMLILEGGQGIQKSKACRAMIPEQYFAENLPNILVKDAMEQLRGKVLIELPEIVNLLHDNPEGLKAFLTRQTDRFRASYGALAEDYPRVSVFMGTTNREHLFNDPTGARRFWPVKVGRIRLSELKRDMPALLAAARDRYLRGRPWWPATRLEARVFTAEQAARQEIDEREATIMCWIIDEASRIAGGRAGLSVREIWENREWTERGFTVTEVWLKALGQRADIPFGTGLQRPVIKCLKRLGCTQGTSYTNRRFWLPPLGWQTGLVGNKGGQDDIPF